MPDGVLEIDANAVIRQLWLVKNLFDDPALLEIRRLLEYQAYRELLDFVSSENRLPEGFDPALPNIEDVAAWIRSGEGLGIDFRSKMRELVLALKAGGAGTFDNICVAYCKLRKALPDLPGALREMATPGNAATWLATKGFDPSLAHILVLLGTFLVVALALKLLDTICNCADRVGA